MENQGETTAPTKPSKQFCDTGVLAPGEKYNQPLHNYGRTPSERCSKFYDEYKNSYLKRFSFNKNSTGGKRRSRLSKSSKRINRVKRGRKTRKAGRR